MSDSSQFAALDTITLAAAVAYGSAAASLWVSHVAIITPLTAWLGGRKIRGHPNPRVTSTGGALSVSIVGVLLVLTLALFPLAIQSLEWIRYLATILNFAVLAVGAAVGFRAASATRRRLSDDKLGDDLSPEQLHAMSVRQGLSVHHQVGVLCAGLAAATATFACVITAGGEGMPSALVVALGIMLVAVGYAQLADAVDVTSWQTRSYLGYRRPEMTHRAVGLTTLTVDPAVIAFNGRRSSWNSLLKASDARLFRLVARHAEPDRSSYRRGCGALFDQLARPEGTDEASDKALRELMHAAITGVLPSSDIEPTHQLGTNRPPRWSVRYVIGVVGIVPPMLAAAAQIIPLIT